MIAAPMNRKNRQKDMEIEMEHTMIVHNNPFCMIK